ncbi:unnamed protein product, partial [Dicrocoelium dendriticum]
MLDTVTIGALLGHSDHAMLFFRHIRYSKHISENNMVIYVTSHFDTLYNFFQGTDWSFLAEQLPDVTWMMFVTQFSKLAANASESNVYRPNQVNSILKSRHRKYTALIDSAWC